MSSTSRRVPSGRIRTCDRADQDRGTEAFISLTLGAPALLLGFVLLIEYSPPLAVMLFSIGLGLMLHGAGRLALRRRTRTSDNRWRTGNGCICFGPSWGFLLWEQLPPSAITVGAISTLCIIYASHDAHSDRTGTLILSLVLLTTTAITWAPMPFNPPRTPELVLDPTGLWLWPDGRYRTYIPWDRRPAVAGRIRRHAQPCAVITLDVGDPVYVPMSPVPMNYVQLQRLVEFYTNHPESRAELTTDQGLIRVRALMRAPVWEIEETMRPAPGPPVRFATPNPPPLPGPQPASAPIASPSPLPTGPVPAPVRGPAASPTDSAAAPPEGRARPGAPAPPAALASPPAPPISPPDPPTALPALDCGKADRRTLDTPLYLALHAVVVFLFFVSANVGQDTALAVLVPGICLLLLLHAAALRAAQIPLRSARRHWVRDARGIWLPESRILPLTRHLGALALALLALVGYWTAAIDDNSRSREHVLIPSLAVATACLAVAVTTWWRTPLPRSGPGIVLSPDGFRTAPGTRREAAFLWEDGPRVVGALTTGPALVLIPDAGTLPADMGATPLTYVQLQRVVALYSGHPEVRAELATDQGLARVHSLMRTPVWRAEKYLAPIVDPHVSSAQPPVGSYGLPAPADAAVGAIADAPPASDASRRPQPQLPSETLDCASADRRRLAAPRRAALQILGIAVVLGGVLATDLTTALTPLLLLVLILSLLRLAALRILQIPSERADRQWRAGAGRIELPPLWAAPLMARLGAMALSAIAFSCWAIALTADASEEQARAISMVAALVCVIVAGRAWRRARGPHGGPEIVLDPVGLHLAPGTRRRTTFRWETRPRVVGGLPSGAILIHAPEVGLVRAPMNAVAVGYVQLQQVADFYSDHRELRAELATDRGLARVRSLMRIPI